MKNRLSVGEFAKLCSTTKETLRHYKNINLLTPKYTEKNGYNYYDVEQYYNFHVISILKMAGVPLKTIKYFHDFNNAENALSVFEEQSKIVEKSKLKLMLMDFMLKSTINNINTSIKLTSDKIETTYFEKEYYFTIPFKRKNSLRVTSLNDISLVDAYDKFNKISLKEKALINYHIGAILNNNSITHFYAITDKLYPTECCHEKPAGKYIYYVKKHTWDLTETYNNFVKYIEDNNIKTTGNIYLYDLTGFILNLKEENVVAMLSVKLDEDI